MDRYLNRTQAGLVLAKALSAYVNQPNLIVLALPRGGVPVAYEIAKALSAPLDVFIVRKLGVPTHPELAMGALAEGDHLVLNHDILRHSAVTEADFEKVKQAEMEELKRRQRRYRGNRPFPLLSGKTVILVDDGVATGASLRAALLALQAFNPNKIIVAVPVASPETVEALTPLVDEFVCPLQPEYLNAVGAWYQAFPQTEDEEVRELLAKSKH